LKLGLAKQESVSRSAVEREEVRMKAAVYGELRQTLLQEDKKALEAVKEKYPWVEFDTVVAIKSQESSRQIRMQHHKFRTRQRIQEFIARYVIFMRMVVIKYFGPPDHHDVYVCHSVFWFRF
jgi:flagellar basal body-associated protein FliL